MRGQIVKALSGFFYVRSDNTLITCTARGKFKAERIVPLVGDYVEYKLLDGSGGVIEEILPRKNSFIRPAVANIDCFVFIASDSLPVTEPFLIDRVSVIAARNDCEFILCINKSDLPHEDRLFPVYSKIGIPVFRTSAVTGEGIEDLKEIIHGKIGVFTGNSGIGKSSILNRLFPDAAAETAEISRKLNRGRHTTRAVQSYDIGNDTVIIDTPGFSSFDVSMIDSIDPDRLDESFVDFSACIGKCRFNDCRHINEPDCAVLEAVKSGKIQTSRHSSYIRLYEMLTQERNTY
ncbi:MAG: ribosome small subunit-dependent GTPase A [Oscillospiraceae bacterium]|nr:ribosome small subunit-dependent GTPase A [Oscillospiraceae bacterium]